MPSFDVLATDFGGREIVMRINSAVSSLDAMNQATKMVDNMGNLVCANVMYAQPTKVLTHYVRHNRKPVATVVALDKDTVGVSFCNKVDHFNKAEGRLRAGYHATKGKNIKTPDNIWINVNWPNVKGRVTLKFAVEQGMKYLKERATRYFKPQVTTSP